MISKLFRDLPNCIDVYSIGTFRMTKLLQISIRDICNIGSHAIGGIKGFNPANMILP